MMTSAPYLHTHAQRFCQPVIVTQACVVIVKFDNICVQNEQVGCGWRWPAAAAGSWVLPEVREVAEVMEVAVVADVIVVSEPPVVVLNVEPVVVLNSVSVSDDSSLRTHLSLIHI